MFWGKHKESGFWIASTYDYRFLWCDHDSLYVAIDKFRLRIMKRDL